jgi:hypothetical protein
VRNPAQVAPKKNLDRAVEPVKSPVQVAPKKKKNPVRAVELVRNPVQVAPERAVDLRVSNSAGSTEMKTGKNQAAHRFRPDG